MVATNVIVIKLKTVTVVFVCISAISLMRCYCGCLMCPALTGSDRLQTVFAPLKGIAGQHVKINYI